VDWLPWYKRGEPHNHPGKPDEKALGEHSDESKLKDAIMMIFNGDHFKWEDNPILESLKCDRITKWSMFVRLDYMDVNDLQIVNRGKIEPMPSWWKELLKTFISLYHDMCCKAKRDLDPEHFSQRMFITPLGPLTINPTILCALRQPTTPKDKVTGAAYSMAELTMMSLRGAIEGGAAWTLGPLRMQILVWLMQEDQLWTPNLTKQCMDPLSNALLWKTCP
jgi:hypothetical protein